MTAFKFRKEYMDAMGGLAQEVRANLLDAILAYAFKGEEPDFGGLERTVFLLVKGMIDADEQHEKELSALPVVKQELVGTIVQEGQILLPLLVCKGVQIEGIVSHVAVQFERFDLSRSLQLASVCVRCFLSCTGRQQEAAYKYP